MGKLTPRQQRFVEEYLVDLNGTQAAVRAGFSKRTANEQSVRLLAHDGIRAALTAAMAARSARTQITQDDVLRRWSDIAMADPNELVQYRRANCRHCWGKDHHYQWSAGEFDRAKVDAGKRGVAEPDQRGGLGFVPTRQPNPNCPECGGEGRGHIHVADTRQLKGAARLLYAGVKSGKDGLEVKMHDQMKALENVARHLGMLKQQHELTGKDGGPVRVKSEASQLLGNLTDEQLAQLEAIAAAVAGSGGDQGGAGEAQSH